MIRAAILNCKIKLIQRIIIVVSFGCKGGSNLLIKYSAPIFTIGKPNAAQIPAISSKVNGFGRIK